ncbi:MAG: CinA family protein [Clostridia bacterium]|nr:CinA family protein [Clostridia bacterium]
MPTTLEINAPAGVANEAAVRAKYRAITLRLIDQGRTITCMESCTSGLIASLITDTEGASAILKGAFITYSNAAKVREGVPAGVIEAHGVYSPETAAAMALACRRAYGADFGLGVTGSFGNPDPANADSVPGEVYFAIAAPEAVQAFHCAVPPQPDRYAYKLYMAGVVADALLPRL